MMECCIVVFRFDRTPTIFSVNTEDFDANFFVVYFACVDFIVCLQLKRIKDLSISFRVLTIIQMKDLYFINLIELSKHYKFGLH